MTASFLKTNGFLATAAMYPTVPKSESIIRVAISAAHSQNDLNRFTALVNILRDKE